MNAAEKRKKELEERAKGYKVGRPSKYKKEYCQMLIDHMSKGFSYESFSTVVKAQRATLYNWEKNPEFLDAKEKATDLCMLYWEEIGLAGTVGKLRNFQTAMWIFNMKNRFFWSDSTDRNLSMQEKAAENKTHEQLKAIDRKALINLVKTGT